ncbi:MAG: DUF805 domain-containing protein [Gemmatimonadaceae bacterium]
MRPDLPSLRTLFTLHGRVSRRVYVATGLTLMFVKYVVDATAIYVVAQVVWTPWDYLVPLFTIKSTKVAAIPAWLAFAMIIWTLPFIWIGVTMMMRRAMDAGRSPAWCAAFFVPFLNYAVMLWLGVLPTVALPENEIARSTSIMSDRYRSALIGAVGAAAVALAAMLVSVFALGSYGITLFLGAPFIQGMVVGWAFNKNAVRRKGETPGVVMLSLLIVAGALTLFALEGALCIAMAFPIATVLALMGGAVGQWIAARGGAAGAGLAAALFVLPTGAAVERVSATAPTYEVVTVVDVAAPTDVVWKHVVEFKDIEAPLAWYFRAGVAYPVRASIVGSGVGAIRRCEFSTGAFVEPITTWDEPRRLAFDVIDAPPALRELSPYSKVYAPHLDGYFHSSRGEFRLVGAAGGKTRLEGHTWYSVAIYPQGYWRVGSEWMLHRIHRRVLDQVKRDAEAAARANVTATAEVATRG